MTTLVVSGAQALGSALVQTASQAALTFANSAISHWLDNRTFEGPRLRQFQLMSSRDGTPLPRTYGRVRLAGQVIWASRLKETVNTQRAGKGGPTQRDYSYSISFALGLCEGEIKSVNRFWVNGLPLTTAGLTYRIYRGTEDQLPDPIMSAIDGDVPAFRGTAYVVFEDFPLDDYGGRLPQFNAEVTRAAPQLAQTPRLESMVKGVHLLPSSGEFAYATNIVEDLSLPGAAKPINMNNISGQADIAQALDQLEDALPECKNVSLVISWFGDDLRAGECKLRPGVESRTRLLDGGEWAVGAETRETAYLISTDSAGRPVYGGTPSDASILQAIRTLKARGYKVMIYPFILMDIPEGNARPDPYGGAEQAKFPWRGRITCHPAAEQTGTTDQSAAASAQVEAFFGSAGPSDFGHDEEAVTYDGTDTGLRRFILHYAKLAQIAGGVERFVISSEMVGLTTIRSSRTAYPAVEKLRALLSDVRSLLPNAQLSYAADWSEYFGHHPSDDSGDVNFHLDALWADENLDAVGIDAYFPLSDWRGSEHVDAEITKSIYDVDYLSAGLRGGEGYEFYYKTPADRDAQIRTLIADGAYQKDWVFRYKDLLNWWSQPHINRLGGLETTQSDWTPQSKPFWLTEIGCPAIDRGANQPNVFFDPKSNESAVPYYSSGTRDDLIQRRYLEAFIGFYNQAENNPSSDVYGGPMVDMDAVHVWCWDARPYPDFPARSDVWADGPNWELGHWLTGRTGLVLAADVVRDLVLKSGVASVDVSDIKGVLEGFTVERPMSTRAALGPLSMLYGFDMVERASGLSFKSQDGSADKHLSLDELAAQDNEAPISRMKDDPEGGIVDVRLHYIDGARDHQPATLFARDLRAETMRTLDIEVPIVMDAGFAQFSAERLLGRASELNQSVNFNLPSLNFALEAGDRVSLPEQLGVWQITRIERAGSNGGPSRVTARASAEVDAAAPSVALTTPSQSVPISWAAKPEIICLDIPNFGAAMRSGPLVGVKLSPFNRAEISSGNHSVTSAQPVLVGHIETPFGIGPIGRFDYGNEFEFTLFGGEFSAVSESDLFLGENRFAVEIQIGGEMAGWELLQIAELELVASNRYRARKLLRGQGGTDADMNAVQIGARIVWLGQGFQDISINAERGETIRLAAIAAGRTADPLTLRYEACHLRPLSPVHAKITRTEDGLSVSWIRRTRSGGDGWGGLDVPLGEDISLFRVEAFENGTLVERVETDMTSAVLTAHSADYLEISQGSTAYGFGAVLRADL